MKGPAAPPGRESDLLSASGNGFRPAAFRRYLDQLLKSTRSDPPKVIESVNRAMALARKEGDKGSLAYLFRARAHAHRAASKPEAARVDYERAIEIFRGGGLRGEVAVTRIGLVDALMYLGRYGEAKEAASAARRWFHRSGDSIRSARVETNLGNILHRLDQPGRALARYDAARRVFSRHRDDGALAVVDFNRGNVLGLLGRFTAARSAYESSALLFRRQGLPARSAQVRYNAAYLSFLENRLPSALQELEDVRPVFEKLRDDRHLALTRLDEAEVLLRLHLWTDAAERAREAADGFRDLGMNYEEAKARAFKGLARARQKDLAGAAHDLRGALRRFEREGNRAWVCEALLHLGQVELEAGRPSVSLRHARDVARRAPAAEVESLEPAARLLEARALAALDRGDRARRILDATLRTIAIRRSPWLEADARELAGVLAHEKGDLRAARKHLSRAVAVIEGLRARLTGDDLKAGFLRDRGRAYLELASIEMKEGRPRRAFEILERGRSRALVDLLAPLPARRRGKRRHEVLVERLLDELGRHYHRESLVTTGSARWAMDAAADPARITRMETEAAGLLRRLDRETESPTATADLNAVQTCLRENEVLVVFYELGGWLGAFEVTRDRFRVHTGLSPLEDVERIVQSLRFQWGRFRWDPDLLKRHAAQIDSLVRSDLMKLHRQLFGWETRADRRRSLLVVPTGVLRSVPFAALHDGDIFLAQQRAVAVVPSATVLTRLRGEPARPPLSGKSVLVGVADERAPEVDREIADLSALLPRALVLRGAEATAEALRNRVSGARILHVATHGLFRADRPQFSGLRLSDRWLYGCDLGRWPIRAELVTLSACVTGLSEAWGSGEWLGLSRALLSAGARRVLVGLWDVDDAATRQLMRHFYAALLSVDRPRPAEALARAQAGMAASGWHPYYWSGFSLIGDL